MHVIFEEAVYFKEGGLMQKLCFVFICLFVVDLLGGGRGTYSNRGGAPQSSYPPFIELFLTFPV